MKFKIFLYLIVAFISCNVASQHSVNNRYLGHWAISNEDDVSFSIVKNGIIKYFENDNQFTYKVKRDSFIIEEEGYVIGSFQVLKISADSLHLKSEDGEITKFVKRNNK